MLQFTNKALHNGQTDEQTVIVKSASTLPLEMERLSESLNINLFYGHGLSFQSNGGSKILPRIRIMNMSSDNN